MLNMRAASSAVSFRPLVLRSGRLRRVPAHLTGRVATRAEAAEASSLGEAPEEPPNKVVNQPVLLTVRARSRVPVRDAGGAEAALAAYMTLPVEQYTVLDSATIERLGADTFKVTIPRMTFFTVWLEPEAEVSVRISASEVRMRSGRTAVRGSPFVERSGMNDKFDMFWDTRLCWGAAPAAGPGGDAAAPASALDGSGPAGGGGAAGAGAGGGGEAWMEAETLIRVWCEVLPPFHLMPRSVLSGSCNAVLRGLVPRLLDAFIANLRTDYERWAGDPEYRRQRREQGAAQEARAAAQALPAQAL